MINSKKKKYNFLIFKQMKEKFLKFKNSGLLLMIIMLLCSVFGVYDGSAMTAEVVNPPGGGAVIVDDTTTVTEARENSPNLFLDTIDDKVTKIRPHDVVLDTISRNISDTRTSNNQIVRHYAIDVIDMTATLSTKIDGSVQQAALMLYFLSFAVRILASNIMM